MASKIRPECLHFIEILPKWTRNMHPYFLGPFWGLHTDYALVRTVLFLSFSIAKGIFRNSFLWFIFGFSPNGGGTGRSKNASLRSPNIIIENRLDDLNVCIFIFDFFANGEGGFRSLRRAASSKSGHFLSDMKKWAAVSAVLIFAPAIILVCPQNCLKRQSFWRVERLGEPSRLLSYGPVLRPQ